ncbi:TolC family protein [Polymorphobacter fuscus]|uniref:TolC family protein n=1 Tax=Sandarakinorhabdus fusca TaxID=1439888 RepID=A0A7C9GP88_9SPHN|nr:TolC family protein [Polymorphobacter fuscus]KAB7647516.1 TolC family protein [Polymorphobacter fuscus]MQT16776.1 TolC family protein [Polymorphobacter fuscus]NJC09236.1 adhesin transport system outer membrane protein [Polymorphobacter fuscus]
MAQPSPAGGRRATPGGGRALLWRVAGIGALVAAAPAPAQLVLPPPGGDPRTIDFAKDPVLRFVSGGIGADAFTAAIAAAVSRHPAVAEAAAGTDTARAQRREVRTGLFPTLSASLVGSQSLARDFVDTSAAVERLLPRGRTDAAINADQLVFDFGATGGRIAGASARVRAAAADADRAATATALSAITAWYQLVAYQALTELSDAMIARHRAIVDDTGARVAAGIGAGGDMARAEASLADAIGEAAGSARALATARARYRESFGAVPPARALYPASTGLAPSSLDATRLQGLRSPDVAAAEALAAAARAEARAARADALPRLSAGVGGTRFNVFGQGPNYDVRGQVVLRQSLSTGGAEAARIAAADARARAAEAAAERVRAEAERDAEAAFGDARVLDASAGALADAYRANRRNRDITAEQFRLSRGTLIDLLQTEAEYSAAARALLLGSVERDLARYTLLARTGQLLRHFDITTRN